MDSVSDLKIDFSDLLTVFLDKGPSEIPVFVNLSYKTALAIEKTDAGFIDQWAAAFHDILENSPVLSSNNVYDVLRENEDAQKRVSSDKPEHENGAWLMYVLLCTTIQQEMALPEFKKLSDESIETEKAHLLALDDHHRKKSQ